VVVEGSRETVVDLKAIVVILRIERRRDIPRGSDGDFDRSVKRKLVSGHVVIVADSIDSADIKRDILGDCGMSSPRMALDRKPLVNLKHAFNFVSGGAKVFVRQRALHRASFCEYVVSPVVWLALR